MSTEISVCNGGRIGWVATAKSGYTPAVGDLVALSDAREVDAITDGDLLAGEIAAIEEASGNKLGQVTVHSNAQRICNVVNDETGSITAGKGVVYTGVNLAREYLPATDNASLLAGIALNTTTGAAAGQVVEVLEK